MRIPADVKVILDAKMAQNSAARAKRGPLAFAFVEQSLPNGVATIVRVNQPGSQRHYAVVSSSNFESSTVAFSYSAGAWYSSQRPDDESPVSITVYTDGRLEANSRDLGSISGRIGVFGGNGKDTSGVGSRFLKQLNKSKETFDVAGFGAARLVSPK